MVVSIFLDLLCFIDFCKYPSLRKYPPISFGILINCGESRCDFDAAKCVSHKIGLGLSAAAFVAVLVEAFWKSKMQLNTEQARGK